jgi:hypothetical protein
LHNVSKWLDAPPKDAYYFYVPSQLPRLDVECAPCRRHVHEPGVLEDCEENDSIEALELLMGIMLGQQRKAFLSTASQQSALDAWQAMLHATADKHTACNGACSPGEPSAAAASGSELPGAHDSNGDAGASSVDAEGGRKEAAEARAAPEAAGEGAALLHAWLALSRVPLEGMVLEELACARCQGLSQSHATTMLALPLNLPTTQVRSLPRACRVQQACQRMACQEPDPDREDILQGRRIE